MMNSEDYKEALRTTGQILRNPIGFIGHEATGEGDNIIIRQNNTIICLLLQVHTKLDNLLNKLNTKRDDPHIEDLIGKLNGLQLGKEKEKSTNRVYTFGKAK